MAGGAGASVLQLRGQARGESQGHCTCAGELAPWGLLPHALWQAAGLPEPPFLPDGTILWFIFSAARTAGNVLSSMKAVTLDLNSYLKNLSLELNYKQIINICCLWAKPQHRGCCFDLLLEVDM